MDRDKIKAFMILFSAAVAGGVGGAITAFLLKTSRSDPKAQVNLSGTFVLEGLDVRTKKAHADATSQTDRVKSEKAAGSIASPPTAEVGLFSASSTNGVVSLENSPTNKAPTPAAPQGSWLPWRR